MKKKSPLFMVALLMIFLSGCSSSSNAENVDLFQYKNAYVGDNSAVVNTIIHLQGAEHFSGFELKTKEQPYGIIVTYAWEGSGLNEKETAINNASYLFTLIQNLDWVIFNFEMVDGLNGYKITREDIQTEYDTNLSTLDSENELKEHIQNSIKDEKKMNRLLRQN